nr:unnamed protein product [Callosobruchus analis]
MGNLYILVLRNLFKENFPNKLIMMNQCRRFISSNLELWPILGLITNFRSTPFVIALFCGTSKPSSVELFFQDFIDEMNELMAQGLLYN